MKALLCLCLLPFAASALTRGAEDYFHAGANKYVGSRLQEASIEVDEGLRHYPNDEKLKMLAAQLKKMKDQQKQDQGQGGSQNSDQKDKDQKNKQDQDKNNGQGQDQANKDEKKDQEQKDKDKQDGKDKEGQGDQDQQQAGKEDDKQDGDSSGQAMAPVKPGQMSKEDAERLLNSYQDDEKKEHSRMGRKARKVQVGEDW